MQPQFSFATPTLDAIRARLPRMVVPTRRRTPVGQLVKSLINGRTRDAVSLAAYRNLGARFGSVGVLAQAEPRDVEQAIAKVTYADAQAEHLIAALRMVEASDGDFALNHLVTRPLSDALSWLERLPGVARKVSASTLNASMLGRPVMIVDTHVLRVLARLGVVRQKADYREASEVVKGGATYWSGDAFLAFHIALKRLGQEVCRWDVPACDACPLAAECSTARSPSAKR